MFTLVAGLKKIHKENRNAYDLGSNIIQKFVYTHFSVGTGYQASYIRYIRYKLQEDTV